MLSVDKLAWREVRSKEDGNFLLSNSLFSLKSKKFAFLFLPEIKHLSNSFCGGTPHLKVQFPSITDRSTQDERRAHMPIVRALCYCLATSLSHCSRIFSDTTINLVGLRSRQYVPSKFSKAFIQE